MAVLAFKKLNIGTIFAETVDESACLFWRSRNFKILKETDFFDFP